jgi:hypothetical protein
VPVVCFRRVSPIAVHPDEGPFTIPFADLHQCKPVGVATYALGSRRSRADREFWSLLGGICGIRYSSNGVPMDYRSPVVENDTYGESRRRTTISLAQVDPAIFDRRRTRMAQEPGR